MKSFVLIVLAFCLLAIPLAAQQPQYLVSAGLGFNDAGQPKVNGWMLLGVKVSDNIYTTTAIDLTGKTSSVRAGFERVMYQASGFTITTKGDAGISTASGSVGSAFGGGGSLLFDVSKWLKSPGSYLVGSVTVLRTSVGDGVQPVFRFGFAKTF